MKNLVFRDGEGLNPTLLKNEKLIVDKETGELREHKNLGFNDGFIFEQDEKKEFANISCRGSFIKHANQGLNTIKPATFDNIQKSLLFFHENGIDLLKTKPNSIEFGTTFEIDRPPNDYLKSVYSFYDTPKETKQRNNGYEVIFEHENYNNKMYNKSAQWATDKHLIRVEKDVNKMRYFEDAKIPLNNLLALTNPDIYSMLFDKLVKSFGEYIFLLPSTISKLNFYQTQELQILTNHRFQKSSKAAKKIISKSAEYRKQTVLHKKRIERLKADLNCAGLLNDTVKFYDALHSSAMVLSTPTKEGLEIANYLLSFYRG